MKTNLKLLTVAAAMFLALALPAGQAVATEGWSVSSACNQGHRIRHQDASCLSAGWNNNPSFWSGVAGGLTYWLKSNCSAYGMVYAGVDVKNDLDQKWKLTEGGQISGSMSGAVDVRSIDCCINHGDQLCYKWQVEKNTADKIRHVTVTGSGYSSTMVDVSTQAKRYNTFVRPTPITSTAKSIPKAMR